MPFLLSYPSDYHINIVIYLMMFASVAICVPFSYVIFTLIRRFWLASYVFSATSGRLVGALHVWCRPPFVITIL